MYALCGSFTLSGFNLSQNRAIAIKNIVFGISNPDVFKFYTGVVEGLDWKTCLHLLIIDSRWTRRQLECAHSSPLIQIGQVSSIAFLLEWLEWIRSLMHTGVQVSWYGFLHLNLRLVLDVRQPQFGLLALFTVILRFTVRVWGRSAMYTRHQILLLSCLGWEERFIKLDWALFSP